MNWEALVAIGGGTAVIFLIIVIPLLLYWRREDAKKSGAASAQSLTATGVILLLVPVVVLLAWKILSATVVHRLGFAHQLIFDAGVLAAIFVVLPALYNALERRGVRFFKSTKRRGGA